MSNLPDVNPRAERVIAQLQQQLGQAIGQNAMLEDVIAQLRDELIAATSAGNEEPRARVD